MATDIATLGIKIDSSQAGTARGELDRLADSGEHAENNIVKLSRAAQALNAVHANVAVTSTRAGGAMKLTANDALNLSRQMADVGVTAAMGMSPLMILVQQGPQIYDVFQQSGLSAKQFGFELLQMTKIVKVVEAANDNLVVSHIAVAAAEAEVTAATNALALANARYGFSMDRNSERLAIQQAEMRLATAEALRMEAANGKIETSITRVTSLSPGFISLAKNAGLIGLAIAAVGTTFALTASAMNDANKDIIGGLGLTEKQLERVKKSGVSTSITMTDAFVAMSGAIGDAILEAFEGPLDTVEKWWNETYGSISNTTFETVKYLVGTFSGGINAIKVALKEDLGGAITYWVKDEVNQAIADFEGLAKKVVGRVNQAADALGFNKNNRLTPEGVNFGRVTNDAPIGGKVGDAFGEGYQKGVNNFVNRGVSRVEDRIRDAAGKGDKEKTGKTEAEKEYERLLKAAESYLASLKEETSEIGKNSIELKMMAADRAAALAPTKELKDEIKAAAAAWKDATVNQAIKDLKRDLADQNDELAHETSLLGMNAKEREIAMAQRQIDLRLRDLERQGITITADLIEQETAAILANAEARGQRKLDIENAREYTDEVKRMGDVMRETFGGFGDLFGNVGSGIENLVNTLVDYGEQYAEIQERIAEADERTIEGQRERERATEDLTRLQMNHYGKVLGSAKTFFKEGSAGYKVLEAAEKAYRLYQAVSTLLAIANSGREMAMDTTKTLTSVANSGTRATADGIAGIAKSIASLPFPFNIAAGAATAAALIGFGVKLFGGGGGAGAATAAANDNSTGYDDSTAYSSPYSTLPGQGGLYDPANAGQGGTGPNANPTTYAQGNTGFNFTYAPTYDARGADAEAVARLEQVIETNRQETIKEARELAVQDIANATNRQRIG